MEYPTESQAMLAQQRSLISRSGKYFQSTDPDVPFIQITESGVSFLNVMTNGGQGDVDIYIKRDDYPT